MSFVFLTDNELGHKHERGFSVAEYVSACARADLIIHDAQYTDDEYKKRQTWGHSIYTQAVRLALSSRAGSIGFFPHDPGRSDDEIDALIAKAQSDSESEGRRTKCFGVREEQVIDLS